MLEREVGMSLPYNEDGVILEVFDFSLGKVSAMIVRYEELVDSFGGLKNAFKSLDTSLLSRWSCGWKLREKISLWVFLYALQMVTTF